jgi:sulfite reductase alpha subunit-like flavoprotein
MALQVRLFRSSDHCIVSNAHTPDNTVYFGCRHAQKDQHYRFEFQSYAEKGDVNYRVACSRDGPEGVKRNYVQDLIEEDGECVWKVLGDGTGSLYISGSVSFIMREFLTLRCLMISDS